MTIMVFNARCGHSGESYVPRLTEDKVSSRRRYWLNTDCRVCRGLDKATMVPVIARCRHEVHAFTQPLSEYPPAVQAARARYYWKHHDCPTCRWASTKNPL